MCVCVCFSVCVVCVSLARATEKSTHRDDELYIESAPLAEILSKCAKLCQANSQKSTQIGELSTQLSPKQLHNFKKTFRHYHATSPPNICTILPTFPRGFPKTFFSANSMTSGHLCIDPRNRFQGRRGFTRLPRVVFHSKADGGVHMTSLAPLPF